MAKRPDDSDGFTLEHDGDDGFGSAPPPAKQGKDAAKKPRASGGGGVGAILAKLPFAAIGEKVSDLADNVRGSVSSSFNDHERPTLPLIMLSAGVLVLVMVLIVMLVLLVGSLSGGSSTAQALTGAGGDASPADSAIIDRSVPESSSAPGIAPDQNAPTVSQPQDRTIVQSIGRDPIFTNPILLDEPALMRDGEIRYNRTPQRNWSLDDIRPGWQELGKLYQTMLREQNTRDFYRLMGSDPPKTDMY